MSEISVLTQNKGLHLRADTTMWWGTGAGGGRTPGDARGGLHKQTDAGHGSNSSCGHLKKPPCAGDGFHLL